MADVIPGIKLIRHTGGGADHPDDPSFPFKLEVNLSPPEFMSFAFICIHGGSEEIIVRGLTQEALEKFIKKNHLRDHARLRHLTITGPEGVVERIPTA